MYSRNPFNPMSGGPGGIVVGSIAGAACMIPEVSMEPWRWPMLLIPLAFASVGLAILKFWK